MCSSKKKSVFCDRASKPSQAQDQRRGIVILGCSGSIGTQTLQVIRQHADKFEVVGLALNSQLDILLEQARAFGVRHLAAGDAAGEKAKGALTDQLRQQVGRQGTLDFGREAVVDLVRLPRADIVVNALVGAAGLRASYETLKAGKVLALANKESLVVGGDLIMPLARAVDEHSGCAGSLMPIDSEHGAIYQCLLGENKDDVAKLWVTASGGPFRGYKPSQLAEVTPQKALSHPTWNMGAKISIDSSTLMNKGLEIIEAHHLFAMPYERIKVVIQPQSAIHSMVEFVDGSVKAHLGTTDMRIPIQFALSYPDRWNSPVEPLDFTKLGSLEFEAPDEETFSCLALARHAGEVGGTLPCAMNAANEVAVATFLSQNSGYLDIAGCVASVINEHEKSGLQRVESIDQLEAVDAWARRQARNYFAHH